MIAFTGLCAALSTAGTHVESAPVSFSLIRQNHWNLHTITIFPASELLPVVEKGCKGSRWVIPTLNLTLRRTLTGPNCESQTQAVGHYVDAIVMEPERSFRYMASTTQGPLAKAR